MKEKNLLKIFMVDDDAFSLAIYKQQLNGCGYSNLQIFLHASECFEQVVQETPDVIFLDHEMEPFNGLDMLLSVKKFYPSIRIIILSGQEEIKNAVDAMLFGASNYVIKGDKAIYQMEKILDGIRMEMSRRKVSR
jgi:DNA-binding NtrC family response regulator